MSVQELASYLCVSPSSLYRLIKSGELKAFKVGNYWRIDLEAVQDWMLNRYESRISPKTKS
jgi:excisionase family DNA binding protein